MPYTHSLLAAVVWFGIGAIVYKALQFRDASWRAALLVGLAVFSHWVLDFLVHRPDLPIYDNTLKVGLGLWNLPVLAFLLEAGLFFAGMYWYFRVTKPVSAIGKYGLIVFGVIMLIIHAGIFWGPPPQSSNAAAVMALVSYFVFAGVAYWLEKKRV
jgi:membrane-bound metal-dependent hydrolase YbcI (DUF457 family)